jgi:2-oxoglutarate ferredoxin oxidoreductase subunit beta
VLGCGGTFFARVPDVAQAQLVEVMKQAHGHVGTGFVEILQNCIVYHDGAWSAVTDKKTAADRQLWCRHGEPLRFGANGAKALRLDRAALALEVFTPGVDGGEDEVLVHDATNPLMGRLLCELEEPMALGVIHRHDAPALERRFMEARPRRRRDPAALQALLDGADTWTI